MKFKIIVLVLLMVISCGSPSGPTTNHFATFTYPLEIGNTWTYEQTTSLQNFNPDSLIPQVPDSEKLYITIQITDFDSVQIGINVYTFETVTYDSGRQTADSATFLFNNEVDGLYEYANSGMNLAVPISEPPDIKNILKSEPLSKLVNKKSNSGFIQAPKQSIKYPVSINSKWLFLDSSSNIFGIDKRVTNYQYIETKIGRQLCFKVEWIYYPDNFVNVIDYISDLGLMKRTIVYKNVEISDYNDSFQGTVDIVQEFNIVKFANPNK